MVNWDVVGDNVRIARERVRRSLDQDFPQDRQLTLSRPHENENGPDCGPVSMRSFDRIGLAFAIELAFFRHTLERLTGAFDPILMLVAFRRQQFDDLERAARAEPAKWAGCVADILTDRIFVDF